MQAILLNKTSPCYSCNQIDNLVKKKFAFQKVGHIGTLDFNAFGLLLILINETNKLHKYFVNLKKRYLVQIKFHISSSTLDNAGELTYHPIQKINFDSLSHLEAKTNFSFQYVIPKLSAKKHFGKPLYFYKHKNIKISDYYKESKIHSFKIINFNQSSLLFETDVESGTYMRSFVQYLCSILNVKGYMVYLKRIQLGPFNLNQAQALSDLNANDFVNLAVYLPFPIWNLKEELHFKKILNGCPLVTSFPFKKLFFFYNKKPLAIYYQKNDIYYCETNFSNLW